MHRLEHGRGARLPDHPPLSLATRGSRWRSRHRLLVRSRGAAAILGSGLALASLIGPASLHAHEGSPPAMEAPVERVPPGSGVPLVGLDFFPGERLRVVLGTSDGATLDVGSVLAGADGHFETVVQIPAGIPAGPATIDAVSTSGIIVRALVTIDPDAPPASYRPVFPAPDAGVDAPDVDVVPFVAAGLGILALAVLVLRTRGPSARVR